MFFTSLDLNNKIVIGGILVAQSVEQPTRCWLRSWLSTSFLPCGVPHSRSSLPQILLPSASCTLPLSLSLSLSQINKTFKNSNSNKIVIYNLWNLGCYKRDSPSSHWARDGLERLTDPGDNERADKELSVRDVGEPEWGTMGLGDEQDKVHLRKLRRK